MKKNDAIAIYSCDKENTILEKVSMIVSYSCYCQERGCLAMLGELISVANESNVDWFTVNLSCDITT